MSLLPCWRKVKATLPPPLRGSGVGQGVGVGTGVAVAGGRVGTGVVVGLAVNLLETSW